MQIKTIKSLQDPENNGRLTGLQVELISFGNSFYQLKLPIVGVELDKWDSETMVFKNE